MAVNNNQAIHAPVVLFSRNVLSVVPEEGLRVMEISITDAGTMVRKASAKSGFVETEGWMLEVNGRFREFKPRGSRNQWAKPFSSFIQLVKSEFDISEGRSITVAELFLLIKNVRDDFSEAPQAESLRSHLGKYRSEDVVSEKILREWPI